MKRNQFIKASLTGLGSICIAPVIASPFQDTKEPIPTERIKEFVAAGHNNLARVKEMLSETPNLISCRYDWGRGDFEEAIEGAGHLGNKDIANYLIEKGARVNLFVLTMLGKTQLVRPVLEAYPHLLNGKGPHGFSLLHHAKVGGTDGKELYDYLMSKGLKDTKFSL